MINAFIDFSNDIKNSTIHFSNQQLDNIIRNYSFIAIPNDIEKLKQNLSSSSIMMIDYYEKSDDKFFIICIENFIIFISKSSLPLLSTIFTNDANLSVCFMSDSKSHFEQFFNVKFNEIEYDSVFQNEIYNFNQFFYVPRTYSHSHVQIWNIIRSTVSGYLIKRGYQKSMKNRLNEKIKKDSFIKNLKDDDFINLRNVGSGSIGIVNLYFYIEMQELFVAKIFSPINKKTKLHSRELSNYSQIDHLFLPKFYGILNNKNKCLIIEYINGQSLSKIEKLQLTENDKFTIIFELMIVFQYLHSKNFVYRDLKPNNVIIDSNKTAILIDFDRMVIFEEDSNKEEHTSYFLTFFCAPEIFKGKYSCYSDIYSIGKMIYYIMKNDIADQDETIEFDHPELNEIFKKCTKINENERPTISQLMLEFYINFHKFIQIENFFEIFKDQLNQCFDNEVIEIMKKLSNKERNDSEMQFKIGCLYNNGKVFQYDSEKAFHYFELAAKKNHSEAQFYIGKFYYEGKVVEKDINKAIEYYELSAEQKNTEALVYLGNLYSKGEVIQKNLEKAKEYYELAAEHNNGEALYCLGNLYSNGEGVKKDYNKAIEYYKLSAKQNNVEAIFALGHHYYIGQVFEINYAKAKELFEEAAKQDYPPAFNSLGLLYINGLGVGLDMDIGIQYFEKAAKMNNQNAMTNLGFIYSYGRGVKQDFEKGRLYFETAAELGNSSAYNEIGNLYYYGVGVEQSYLKAKEFYEKSAELNNVDAINVLGYLYKSGKGVELDYTKAREYFEKAVKMGQPNAHNNLGNIYLNGNGVPKDYLRAKELFKVSSKLGNARGSYLLANLYFKGYEGIPQNYLKALKYYEKSANEKFGPAVFILGDFYYYGFGVDKNYKKAKEYYELAAQYRNSKANLQLGILYYYGKGFDKDYEKAREYFVKSAKENDINAFYYLAQIYEKGKGTEIDIEKAIDFYKKCSEKQDITVTIDYNQGWTPYSIKNEKFYHSINNLGLIYLFKYKDFELADKYFSIVGHNNFPHGKNNNGFFNLFYLNNHSKAFNMFESASNDHFSISEFQLGYMEEKEGRTNLSISHYQNVLKYEIQYNEIDDEQLYASNVFIFCLTNLKLFLFSQKEDICESNFLINAIFKSLFGLLFYPNYFSYSFNFVIDKRNEKVQFLNLKDFFLNFPWNGSLNRGDNTKSGWKIIEQNRKSKKIIINIELMSKSDSFFEKDDIVMKSSIIDIKNAQNVKMSENLNLIQDDEINYYYDQNEDLFFDESDDKYHIEKCVISSVGDDAEHFLVYPKFFKEMLIKNFNDKLKIIEAIVNDMMNLLYRPPYYILFGRIGESDQTIKKINRKEIDSKFFEGFDLGETSS